MKAFETLRVKEKMLVCKSSRLVLAKNLPFCKVSSRYHYNYFHALLPKIPADDAVTLNFPIKPTELGNCEIDIQAIGPGVSDAVKRDLLVKVGQYCPIPN